MENTHLQKAKDAIKAGDLITATVEATAAIKEDAGCADAYLVRGQLSMMFGDRDGAGKDFMKAAELNPSILDTLSGEFKNREENPVYKVPGLKKR